jgi:REP element-mobilizing transposase RayT
MLDPNPERQRRAVSLLKSEPLILDDAAREIVADTFVDHCRLRNWTLLAQAVRTNHAHAVIENAGVTPERMLIELKGYSTRRLRGAGIIAETQDVWVHHGSTRYLWTPKDVESAIAYVELGQ